MSKNMTDDELTARAIIRTREYRAVIKEKIEGKIKADHDDQGHWYILPNGDRVKSVTGRILSDKSRLIKWAVRIGFEWMEQEDRWQRMTPQTRDDYLKGAILAHEGVRDQAGDIGHKAHECIENYLNDWIEKERRPADVRDFIKYDDPRVWNAVRGVEKMFIKEKLWPVATELLVGSEKEGVAGTLDAIVYAMERDELCLGDHKTSNAIQDSYAMQVAIYKKMFEDMSGLKIQRGAENVQIYHLLKDVADYHLYEVPRVYKALLTFRHSMALSEWFDSSEKKVIKRENVAKKIIQL